ncbi:MAG: type I restriction-modification system subunit M, partial [Halobacteriota archaeon]
MANGDLNWITSFIWGVADDILRDLYVRGKYRDVVLPMVVLRRLDAVLEPTKQAVLDMKASLDKAGITSQDLALRQASGQAFYNTSKFTLRDLRARASQQQLRADFEAYLDGFSPNVQDILDNFEFRNQIPRLSKADVLGTIIERFLEPSINLSPNPVLNIDGSVKYPGLDNHAMGTIFEELVRRFNEENNEEAGEHWTPRDAVRLMAKLILLPIADKIESSTYLLYDGACGTGGMLTVAEETLQEIASENGKDVATHLYGQEINAETYAICKADLLLKGEGDAADNIVGGSEYSTLTNDAFPSREFDFMLSNPPYGKSWKSDLERLGGKDGIKDPRFVIEHAGDPEYSLITRSSDGQMLFLANMVSKMKHGTPLGSRIAEVHNGSSLFTGDAGQGESNIRRWIIENDWLEAIVALPLNMFYNTGIATYIWVLTNRKPDHRKGKVQLIDATQWYKPLRKNLGKKNCELSEEDITRICDTFLAFKETEQSKIFPNEAFGYSKVTVERPLRLRVDLDASTLSSFHATCAREDEAPIANTVGRVANLLGPGPHLDFNVFMRAVDADADKHNIKLTAKRKKLLKSHIAKRDKSAIEVIAKIHKAGKVNPDPLKGLFDATVDGKHCVVEYEPDTEL